MRGNNYDRRINSLDRSFLLLFQLVTNNYELLSLVKIRERQLFLCDDTLNETSCEPKRTGKAKATRHRVVETGKGHFLRCGA
jgi:hypothetical protein